MIEQRRNQTTNNDDPNKTKILEDAKDMADYLRKSKKADEKTKKIIEQNSDFIFSNKRNKTSVNDAKKDKEKDGGNEDDEADVAIKKKITIKNDEKDWFEKHVKPKTGDEDDDEDDKEKNDTQADNVLKEAFEFEIKIKKSELVSKRTFEKTAQNVYYSF